MLPSSLVNLFRSLSAAVNLGHAVTRRLRGTTTPSNRILKVKMRALVLLILLAGCAGLMMLDRRLSDNAVQISGPVRITGRRRSARTDPSLSGRAGIRGIVAPVDSVESVNLGGRQFTCACQRKTMQKRCEFGFPSLG